MGAMGRDKWEEKREEWGGRGDSDRKGKGEEEKKNGGKE